MISRRPGEAGDAGISINGSPDVLVAHNSVLLRGTYPDAIEYRFPGAARVDVCDNCCDARITMRDDASAELKANLTSADPAWFADPDAGDLHLKAPAPQALAGGTAGGRGGRRLRRRRLRRQPGDRGRSAALSTGASPAPAIGRGRRVRSDANAGAPPGASTRARARADQRQWPPRKCQWPSQKSHRASIHTRPGWWRAQ